MSGYDDLIKEFVMSRRTTGTVLLLISALLYATRYLSAAIFGSSLANNWSKELFDAMLQYVGQGLPTWGLIALIAGVGYLLWAEVEAMWTRNTSSNGDQRSEWK